MKIPDLLKNSIDGNHMEEFRRSLLADNFRRGKILAVVVIAMEAVLAAADIAASILKVDSRFKIHRISGDVPGDGRRQRRLPDLCRKL